MKNKFFKLLSIMLAIMVVVSGFAGALSVSATTPTTVTYYVSANGSNDDDGSDEKPFQTIGGALAKAVAAAEAGNYNNADSTVNLKLLGTEAIAFGDGVTHNFKLNIATDDSLSSPCTVYITKAFTFGGETNLDNLIFDLSQANAKEVYLNGNSFKMGDNVEITGLGAGSYFTVGGTSVQKAQTVYFTNKSSSTGSFQFYTIGGGSNNTYENDMTFVYNAPNYSQTILVDSISRNKVNTVKKNLNLNFVAARSVKLDLRATLTGASAANDTGTITFEDGAALQVINSIGGALDYSAVESLFPANSYIITNDTNIKDVISFTETAGTYTIGELPADHTLQITPKGGEAYTTDSSTLTLQPGEYTLSLVDNSAKPKDVTYYVSNAGDDANKGTDTAPFKTISGALTKAVADANAGRYNLAESTVSLKLLGTEAIAFGDGVTHNFKLNIATDDSLSSPCTVYITKAFTFGGETNLDNLIFDISKASAKEVYLNGNSFKMGDNVEITGLGAGSYFTVGGTSVQKAQTVYFTNKSSSTGSFQFYTIGGGSNNTYENDMTFVYNAPNYSQTILVDSISRNKVNTVKKNLNLNFVAAGSVKLDLRATLTGASAANDTGRIVFADGAALQLINSIGSTLDYSAVESMLPANRYIITNLTGVKDIINFTETAGTFTVKEGYNVTAISSDKNVYKSEEGKLVLGTKGEFKLIIEKDPDPATNNYSEYINKRGNNLKNTYLKLKNKEDINVVYFGGSVTGGSGASAPDADSWRAKVGNWLTENFPISSVNNMNFAIGGTGTLLGAYRVEEEVLPTQPDLVFVEFAINDRYNGATTEQAKTRFETIVRKIRAAYPDCDIVTLLVTDNSTFNDDLNDALFTQAQAHEDISIAYGIPSIYIGRALSDTVADKANWGNYYADSVHPNEAGYEVHYNVIKEYLNNELNHGNYEGEVANHTVPEQVSKTLLDGDVDLIKVDQAFIDASTAKGGVGFTFNSGIHQFGGNKDYNAFVGAGENIDITSDGNDYAEVGKFVFEFTGTELAVLSMGTHVAGYSVKVDGGEAYEVSLSGNFVPYVLATGLKSATHTVEVSPIYRTCNPHCGNSHVDWVYAFFTSDATKSSHTHDYGEYVPNGDATCDTDGTKSAICSICLNTDTVADVGSAGHKFTNYVSDGNATCTEDGTKTATCDRDGCGAKSEPIADVGSAGHKFTNYVNDNNATCSKDGTKTAICDRDGCEAKDVVTIAGTKKAHTYSNACDTSCNVCKAIRKVAAHKYSNSCDTSCNICGAKRSVSHDYDMYKVKKATPEKDGKKYYKCEDCGATKTTTIYKVTKIKLSTTKYTYNGKSKKPSVTVYDSKGNKISSKYYDVKYASGRKMVGKYKVTVKLEGKYYDDDLKTYFTINPGKTSVSKVSAAKKSLKVTVKKKSTQVTGYQIEYSTSKTFKDKYTKSKTIKKYSTTSVTLKSLKAKKTYYVRVRTYKTVDGKKYYSAWSDYKAKKTK